MVELHASFLEMRNLSVISSVGYYKRFKRNSTAIWIFSINFKREKFISERSFFSNLIINEAKDNCIILFEESRIRHPTFSHVCVLFSQLVATLLHVEFDGLQFSYRCLTRIYCTPFRSVSRFIQKYSENRNFYGCRSFLQLNFDTACLQAKKKRNRYMPVSLFPFSESTKWRFTWNLFTTYS